ncbi:MAG: DUF454 family protein [Rhizobiales bacterium]|nr:DUF454 family protein [Hyphomicrobiales bacterium]
MRILARSLYLGLGWLGLGLGILGIVFPLFPSAPFLLVAVWAFSRSSPELAERIRNHRLAGPFIRDWQDEGVISPGVKLTAMAMMAAMFAYVHLAAGLGPWEEAAVAAVLLAVAGFILSRPSRRTAE